ncbi:hypothetical protein PUNSTDRAFT_54089 [Punctularia strigosozonata HHB-11173 SS5]|uniref:uncharacterized protein n=1 Tax=Punctularia strigosozonata (strain HHB-11173) TaxID=741275 RepID=UPI000441742B|nr:uncharacterized protein PUNSTDRAFT_54089 [Punctularia strigosozonata HHB-11173 SS5]EIN06686.1 hypothetical protein PUNSTDRAFT_54089 [Punctularia strigosozonata HHB-11173 SS5]
MDANGRSEGPPSSTFWFIDNLRRHIIITPCSKTPITTATPRPGLTTAPHMIGVIKRHGGGIRSMARLTSLSKA